MKVKEFLSMVYASKVRMFDMHDKDFDMNGQEGIDIQDGEYVDWESELGEIANREIYFISTTPPYNGAIEVYLK